MKKKPKFRIVAYRRYEFSEVVYRIQKRRWYGWEYITTSSAWNSVTPVEFPTIDFAERHIKEVLAFKPYEKIVKEL